MSRLPAGGRMQSGLSVKLAESEEKCAKLAEANLLLAETLKALLDHGQPSTPDGLNCEEHPNLFSFLGAARSERANADYINAARDGWNQEAMLEELEDLLVGDDEWCPSTMTEELWQLVRDLLENGVRVVKLRRVDPSTSHVAQSAEVNVDEVHFIDILGACYEMFVPTSERRWSLTRTTLTEVPCTLEALEGDNAANGDVYLGLLPVVLAIMVPNGSRIRLGVVVDDRYPVVFMTHGSGNVHWSRTMVPQPQHQPQPHSLPQLDPDKVCTITLLLAIIAAAQGVPYACIHPIGSHLLGRGGNLTIGNYGCRAGRIGIRRKDLSMAIRAALVKKLAGTPALEDLIRRLDSNTNTQLRAQLSKRRHAKQTYEEEFDEEPETDVLVELVEKDDASNDGPDDADVDSPAHKRRAQ
jgi:hypothetical protein